MSEIETPKQAARRLMTYKLKENYEPKGFYTYHDLDANPLYWRIRLQDPQTGDKVIRPMRLVNQTYELREPVFADGKPLYNLHLITKNPDKTVFIVEGEKCADALTKLGLLATTSGAAQSAKDANWQILAGREVALWPDNDEAGLQYANDVTTKLSSLSATIKQIDISLLNLPKKGDCYDWLVKFKESHGRDATSADIKALLYKTELIQVPTSDYLITNEAKILPQTDDEVIERLAALKPLDYDRVRVAEAKVLKVQVKTLDTMVKAEREASNQGDSPFSDITPWKEEIAPAQLLDEVTSTIQRFIVLDKHQAQTAALWVAACWFIDVIDCAPIALINAPERACGKTQLLTVLARLAPRTAQASGISSSVLFRMIEAYQPTLFIDEVETVLKDNEDLRGLINAGHTRDSAFVWRSVAKGDDFEPKRFTVWGMKAIAGINAIKLAETVTSRSIVFELRRKTASEIVERLRRAETGLFEILASKLARFKDDFASEVQQVRPILPDALGDREQDNFEPLFQIATVAGEHWPNTALNAALRLSNATQAPMSSANELLADIQEIFDTKQVIKISTTELISALCDDTEKSWATYNRGKSLSPRQLSNKLKDYGITSKTIRTNSYETAKGYECEQFKDAFARYLADHLNLPSQSNILLEAYKDGLSSVTDRNNVTVTDFEKVTLVSTPILDCDVVTDKTPILECATRASDENQIMEF
jgi:putative DNA primase/helicase